MDFYDEICCRKKSPLGDEAQLEKQFVSIQYDSILSGDETQLEKQFVVNTLSIFGVEPEKHYFVE